jgi:hypothetical protein
MNLIRTAWFFALVITALTGCVSSVPYFLAVAEEKAVRHCTYMDTLSENSDMGAFQIHPKLTFDGRDRVLRRAEMLNATHVVWLADQPCGSIAIAYYCPE